MIDEERNLYFWEEGRNYLTVGQVMKFMEIWAEMKSKGCQFNIITQNFSIIDGWLQMGRPDKIYHAKLKASKPKSVIDRMRKKKELDDTLRRCFEDFEKKNYMEIWRLNGRRV